ncbi:cyclase [Ornithinimicrobium sp. LYQ92]|uniref:SRPBCC family protein n=1 Tax=Serinicoccus sp. LYQ92 TaxID=3378798 RepID=UPI0038551164
MPEMIEVITEIAAPCAVVFDLELDVDVHAASLAGSRERAVTLNGRRALQLGDEVTFRAHHFGVPWRMSSRITAYERPRRFVDEQTSGPFTSLRHEHLFDAVTDEHTRMTDRLHITAPFGYLGAVTGRILLAPYLRRLLCQRAAHIKALAEATGTTA